MPQHGVIFDHGPLPGGTAFLDPADLITADRPDQVADCFAAMTRAQAQGKWLAGFAQL